MAEELVYLNHFISSVSPCLLPGRSFLPTAVTPGKWLSFCRNVVDSRRRSDYEYLSSIAVSRPPERMVSSISLIIRCAEQLPAHDLKARRAARESRPRPWLENSVLLLSQPKQHAGAWFSHSTSKTWVDDETTLGGSTPREDIPFTSPLNKDPKITRVNELLQHDSRYGFSLRFFEPRRALDISPLLRLGLAKYLRSTMETVCFDWISRWLPREADLMMLDAPDQLDLPAWVALLGEHYHKAPTEAFGLSERCEWHFNSIERIRHDAVHRREFNADSILAAIRLAFFLNDHDRAEEIQWVVKVLYETLSSGKAPHNAFKESAFNTSTKSQASPFDMMYSMLHLVSHRVFELVNRKSPDRFLGQVAEEVEYPILCGCDTSGLPTHGKDTLFLILDRLRRELRNQVEHRNVTNAEEIREIVGDAVKAMLLLGESGTAKEILRIWRRFTFTVRNIDPQHCSSRPVEFLRRMKDLDCWKGDSSLDCHQICSRDLIVRKCHPYLHCMRPFIQTLQQQAETRMSKWSGEEPFPGYRFTTREPGLFHVYRISSKWYSKISTGELDIDEVYSPAVEYWSGKLKDPKPEATDIGWPEEWSQSNTPEVLSDWSGAIA